jgi:hypothetical protein
MAKKVALAFQELALALMAKKMPRLLCIPCPAKEPTGRDGGRGQPAE